MLHLNVNMTTFILYGTHQRKGKADTISVYLNCIEFAEVNEFKVPESTLWPNIDQGNLCR